MADRVTGIRSLRSKFVRILLGVSLSLSLVTTSIVALMSAQTSSDHFAAVQGHIQEGIISKGSVLTRQHALALRGLALDNAFLDMQRLVQHAVEDDPDLAYGLLVNTEGLTLAKGERGSVKERDQSPDKHAWRALGLRQNELLVESLGVRRVTRMGRDLLEVAAPVTSEEGELLGTIRYGLSTQRMHEALARAKSESDSRLWRSMLLMGALVTVVTGIGLLLSRAQAVRITRPVTALRAAAEALASGDRSVRVDIRSGDELSLLGASFNHMVDELDASYRELERVNRTLEQKVEARTAELALKNRDMRLVLDNVDQGFINLSPSGVMAGERSAIVTEWFGASERVTTFWEYIEPISRSFALGFRTAWSQLEDAVLPLEVCLNQLPSLFTNGTRTWSIRYLPIQEDEAGERLEGVLMVIAEVTERLLLEREEARHRELMQAFKHLMLDRFSFMSFLQDASTLVQRITAPPEANGVSSLRRTLHTLKGNASAMGLAVVAELCHAMETELVEKGSMAPSTVAALHSRWSAIREHVETFVRARGPRVIEVPETEYTALIARLSSTDRDSELLQQILSWQLEPAQTVLSRLGEQAKSLALRLGRGPIDVEVSCGNVRLDMRHWAPFFAELVHIVRNAVDHGLESPEERLALGKPPKGKLTLAARVEAGELTFEVGDDGRGIDWASIVEGAKERGLPHSTQAELLDALCEDGLTTRRVATDISGRGIGMSAFRRRLDALSGALEVRSSEGAGTSWLMHFHWPVEGPIAELSVRPSKPGGSAPARCPPSEQNLG